MHFYHLELVQNSSWGLAQGLVWFLVLYFNACPMWNRERVKGGPRVEQKKRVRNGFADDTLLAFAHIALWQDINVGEGEIALAAGRMSVVSYSAAPRLLMRPANLLFSVYDLFWRISQFMASARPQKKNIIARSQCIRKVETHRH